MAQHVTGPDPLSDSGATKDRRPEPPQTSVLYNAACPVCKFEIDHYRSYVKTNSLPIGFEDLNTTELKRWGLTPDQAARRLYLMRGDDLLSGVPAFIALWSDMPRYRWLARCLALPGIHRAACGIYDRVLAPILYRRQRHRYAGAEKSGNDARKEYS